MWDALTRSEWTTHYGYRGRIDIDPQPGGFYCGYTDEAWVGPGVSAVVTDGEAIEANPRRRTMTWRMAGDPDMAVEGHTKLTYDIEQTSAA